MTTDIVHGLTGQTREQGGRVLVLHVDDVGMCHGANAAFIELSLAGQVTCGSIMVPCPWFREIAEAAVANPALDLGVHLTLTAEWPTYRWRPISTASRASGLIDGHGFMHRNCLELRPKLVVEAAEAEFRAQIDTALAAGIDLTHLDTHMGAALVPELIDLYVRLGLEYRLPVLLPRELDSYTGVLKMGEIPVGLHAGYVRCLEDLGLPVFDRFRMSPWAPTAECERTYRTMIEDLPPGSTFFGLHCNTSGDIEAIVPPRAHFRTDEYRLFASGAPVRWARDAGIRLSGMREVRDLWRAVAGQAGQTAQTAQVGQVGLQGQAGQAVDAAQAAP